MVMPSAQAWTARDVAATFLMWTVMMTLMTTPSVTPMVATYAGLTRGRSRRGAGIGGFLIGYLAVWSAFSAAATLLQWALHSAGLVSDAMRATPVVGGLLLVLAGAYQFSPLKNACLGHCRSPVSHLMAHWQDGAAGAFRMGLSHGVVCVGCCWALMLILFPAGVMNLLWVAVIAAFVLVEKALPLGRWTSRAAGAALAASGVWLALRG